ncbi:MAG TPA: hypothetical protein P5232_02610 [Candidatus Moranbacteria bacterium]|nr:hypothetical protein [Candidatus Moranbacteria bacterium]
MENDINNQEIKKEYNPNSVFEKQLSDSNIVISNPSEKNNSFNSKKKIIVAIIIAIPVITLALIGFKVYSDLKNQREKTNEFVQKQIEKQSPDYKVQNNVDDLSSYSNELKACFKECLKIPAAAQQSCNNGCWLEEARRIQDMSLCLKWKVETDIVGSQAICQMEVAIASGNLDNCEKIQSSNKDDTYFKKYKCYEEIAKAKKDTSICEKIPRDYLLGSMYNDCIK